LNEKVVNEVLEFLQLPPNLLTRGIVEITKKVIEGTFPMSEGLGFPIKPVGSRAFKYIQPTTLETASAPEVAEKTEVPIAGLSDWTIPTADTIKRGVKDMITRETIEDSGWNIVTHVTTRLMQMVHLPIEKAVIDAMKASTCQTAGATACWDATSGVKITKDIFNARINLKKKGYTWGLHQLIVSPYDFGSMVDYYEDKGFLKEVINEDQGITLARVAKIIDLPVIIEPAVIGTTDVLADTAIVHARNVDWGALFQRHPLKTRSWEDDAIEGARWIEVTREALAKRIMSESVFTITNTVT